MYTYVEKQGLPLSGGIFFKIFLIFSRTNNFSSAQKDRRQSGIDVYGTSGKILQRCSPPQTGVSNQKPTKEHTEIDDHTIGDVGRHFREASPSLNTLACQHRQLCGHPSPR